MEKEKEWPALNKLVFSGNINIDLVLGKTLWNVTVSEYDENIGIIGVAKGNEGKSLIDVFVPMSAIAKIWIRPNAENKK